LHFHKKMYSIANIRNFLERNGLLQFARFACVGLLCAVIEIGIYTLLGKYVGINIYIGNPIAYSVAVFLNYVLSRAYVFETGRHSQRVEFLAFYGVALVGLGINQSVLYLSMQYLRVPAILVSFIDLALFAKIIAIVVTVLWNFTMKKLFVFKG
jgi:putative flippase GtrA